MTEREVVAVAIASMLAAAFAVDLSIWVVAVGLGGAVAIVATGAVRGPSVLVGIVVVLVVSFVAVRAERGLDTPAGRGPVSSVATLVSDPQVRPGGLVVELSVSGVRYRAFVPGELAAPIRNALTGERLPVRGRIVALRGNWEWRASRHLSGALRLDHVGPAQPGAWWWSSANWLHRTVDTGLGSFSDDERALFLGVVLGDDRDQSEIQKYRFRSSGLAHLLAVSGQNVGFVVLVASPVLRRLRLRARWLATGALVTWFAVVTRLEPSVLRAVAMALIAATAAWRGRHTSGLRIVATAVIVLVVIDPLLVWSLGFRLSVGASVALVSLSRPLVRIIGGPSVLGEGLAVSLAAHVGTAPLIVGFAGSVPLLGPMVNLAAVPVAGWLMAWGMVAGPLAGLASSSHAALFGLPARLLLWWLSGCARFGSSPGLPRIGPVGVAGSCMAILALAVVGGRGGLSVRTRAIGAAVVVLGLSLTVFDTFSAGSAFETSANGSISLWNRGGIVVVHLRGHPTESDMLNALARARADVVDLVIVTGGGGLSSTVVFTLRQAVAVGAVFAADPAQIRDCQQLVPGPIRAGPLVVTTSREGEQGWSVVVEPASAGESAESLPG